MYKLTPLILAGSLIGCYNLSPPATPPPPVAAAAMASIPLTEAALALEEAFARHPHNNQEEDLHLRCLELQEREILDIEHEQVDLSILDRSLPHKNSRHR